MRRPPLLLLDEPADGLDLPGREALLAALATLASEQPAPAVVLVTHHLEELPATTTHALLLKSGRAVASGAAPAVLTAEPLSACFGVPVTVSRAGGRWAARATAQLVGAARHLTSPSAAGRARAIRRGRLAARTAPLNRTPVR